MDGCDSRLSSAISERRLERSLGDSDSRRIAFTATSTPVSLWCARYTVAKEPLPMRSDTSHDVPTCRVPDAARVGLRAFGEPEAADVDGLDMERTPGKERIEIGKGAEKHPTR